jgi:hypothetical protein
LEDGRELVVGWDGPLASFFAQIFEPPTTEVDDEGPFLDEKEPISIGAGLMPNPNGKGYIEDSIRLTSELASRLAEHSIELTSEQLAQLEQDKLERGSEVTPFQLSQMDFFDNAANVERLPRDDS